MEDEVRIQYEGFRPGMYVRVEIQAMPWEFVNNFDPSYPVVLGGLLSGEDDVGYLQVSILHSFDMLIIHLVCAVIFGPPKLLLSLSNYSEWDMQLTEPYLWKNRGYFLRQYTAEMEKISEYGARFPENILLEIFAKGFTDKS